MGLGAPGDLAVWRADRSARGRSVVHTAGEAQRFVGGEAVVPVAQAVHLPLDPVAFVVDPERRVPGNAPGPGAGPSRRVLRVAAASQQDWAGRQPQQARAGSAVDAFQAVGHHLPVGPRPPCRHESSLKPSEAGSRGLRGDGVAYLDLQRNFASRAASRGRRRRPFGRPPSVGRRQAGRCRARTGPRCCRGSRRRWQLRREETSCGTATLRGTRRWSLAAPEGSSPWARGR